jgi:molybdenum cofactor biosynthesis enzyme MoaA
MCIVDRPDHRIEPNFDDLYKMIDLNLKDSINVFAISGGEPTLRKDLILLISKIQQKYPLVDIFLLTNARAFSNKNYLNAFSKLNLDKLTFAVPIYNYTPVKFDAISRAKNSFSQTTKGVKNLLNIGAKVELRTVIHKYNYRDLENIANFIKNNFSTCLRVLFVSSEFSGNALKNDVFIRLSYVKPFLEKALDVLTSKYSVCVELFPLCLLNSKYFPFATKQTVFNEEYEYARKCDKCSKKNQCYGFWKGYIDKFGDSELKPF